MLAVGTEMLQEMSLSAAWRSLTARQVAKRAGLTTGSFYNYWSTQEQFVADLVDHLLDPDTLEAELVSTELSAALAGVTGDDPAAEQRWIQAGRRHLDALTGDGRYVAEARLAGCFHDALVAGQLAATHRAQRRAYARLAGEYLTRRERAPIEPFTIDEIGETLAALTRGYASMHAADRCDPAIGERYARAVLGTVTSLSCPLAAVSTRS